MKNNERKAQHKQHNADKKTGGSVEVRAPSSQPAGFNLMLEHEQNLASFKKILEQHRYWRVLTQDATDNKAVNSLIDSTTLTINPPATALRDFLKQHPFVYLRELNNNKNLATLHCQTKLLWNKDTSDTLYLFEDGIKAVNEGRWAGLKGWKLPSVNELNAFATTVTNPHRKGQEYRLATLTNQEHLFWQTDQGCCYVDSGRWGVSNARGSIFARHTLWHAASTEQIQMQLITRGWCLVAPYGTIFSTENDTRKPFKSNEDFLFYLDENKEYLMAASTDNEHPSNVLHPFDFLLDRKFENIDHTPCRLPHLDTSQLSDPEKGMWELWQQDAATLKSMNLVARDPGRDIQRRAVAIDFGTSSTVVAMDTASGARELLRIGVRDFYQAVDPKHFENPTVLECLDFSAFKEAWQSQAYRPELNWNWMRAAHEAQTSFRDNPGDTAVLACMIPRLKQWALRSAENHLLRITGRQGMEVEIPHHIERNPIRGQPIEVRSSDIFDPIELYAWYLGMAINWRGRGIFLKYYLSFPVKYPLEVKNKILASFRRGLQRSFPQTLIDHHPQVLNEFEVQDLASEPAAYAAAALPYLDIEPSEEGVPYAVFDFGGGTSDFDFGVLRWANEEEEDQGYERVFEHLASSGDNYLGGENLLEHLVYESFKNNLDVMRKERVQFTQPIDTESFPGSEAFLAATQAAQTNSIMLAAKLRPFMEEKNPSLETQLKLELINTHGEKVSCELILDQQQLDELLETKIKRGMQAFLAEIAKLKPTLPEHPIHVLLAGNGSRSRHLQALCDIEGEAWKALCKQAFGQHRPEIIIHAPLAIDESNPHAPTAKTGVALGLLQVAPGENTLLLNNVRDRHDGQAPFAWFIGKRRRGQFDPILTQDVEYEHWHELGMLQQGVFNLFATTSPRALSGMHEGDPEIKKHRLDFPSAATGDKLFARAKSPNTIELATASNLNELDNVTKTNELILKI